MLKIDGTFVLKTKEDIDTVVDLLRAILKSLKYSNIFRSIFCLFTGFTVSSFIINAFSIWLFTLPITLTAGICWIFFHRKFKISVGKLNSLRKVEKVSEDIV